MPSIESQPEVLLRQGKFLGTSLKGSFPSALEAFYAIPYALPTSGQRRFCAPVPVPASKTVFDASRWGQRPPSMTIPGADLEAEGEDCLNLNVFRPRLRVKEKKLPVVVMFNGGAFNMGSAKARELHSLVGWSAEPIIGVSFNYRVGALGFLSCKLAAKYDCLNVGLKDQRLLLLWLQENISEFGGDPDNITAAGYSAGAHSIGHHLMNPFNTSKPLFARAIMESGAPTSRCVYPYDHPTNEIQFNEFLKELNCQNLPEDRIIPYLRSLPFEEIRDASAAIFGRYSPSMRWPWQPVIDGLGGMIPVAPIDAWQSDKWHKMPVMTGFCTNEGSVFVPSNIDEPSMLTDWFKTLLPGFSRANLASLEKLYPIHRYEENRGGLGKQFHRFEAAYAHFAYIAPIRYTAHLMSASEAKPPVYLYEYGVVKTAHLGARHSDHIQHTDYLSAVVDISQRQKEISGYMHACWTSFIATGDPNAVAGNWPERPTWDVYSEDQDGIGKKMAFGIGNDEIAGGVNQGIAAEMISTRPGQEECEFWWTNTALFEQNPPTTYNRASI